MNKYDCNSTGHVPDFNKTELVFEDEIYVYIDVPCKYCGEWGTLEQSGLWQRTWSGGRILAKEE